MYGRNTLDPFQQSTRNRGFKTIAVTRTEVAAPIHQKPTVPLVIGKIATYKCIPACFKKMGSSTHLRTVIRAAAKNKLTYS